MGPLHPVGKTQPILPLRYGGALGSGYVNYPSWLAGLEEYFRLLRLVFVDAWHEEAVEQIAQRYLATLPGRKAAPAAQPAHTHASSKRRSKQRQPTPPTPPTPAAALVVSAQEVVAYARRIEGYRAAFQAG